MMNDQLLQHAISLNNDGVSHIVSGNDRTAVKTLSQSLVAVKAILGRMTTNCEASNRPATPPGSTTTTAMKIVHSEVALPIVVHQHTNEYHHLPFVYNKAIMVNSSLFMGSINNSNDLELEQQIHLYSAIILLNLAIVHHRAAIKTLFQEGDCTNKIQLFTKTEELYQMIHTLLKGYGFDDGRRNENETALFIKLVSLNNIYHIQLTLSQQDVAREAVKELYELIGSNETTCRPLFTTEEWNGLLVNTMSIACPFVAAPAA